MNRFIIASLLFLGAVSFVASDSFAQEFAQPYKKYEFGPFGSAGLSVFQGEVPDGSKTDVHVAFTFGAMGALTFNPDWGVALALGYESRGMYFHEQAKDIPNQDFSINYLSIQPSLKFKSFLLGINIGVPMGGTAKVTNAFGTSSADIPDSSMNTIIDIRAAGLLPIVENDMGNLDFYIQASYCISDAIGGGGFLTAGQTTGTPVTNSPLPTLQIGLAYLFSPGGKQ
ncbi:MAG TPA: outer membrane beta-barrel protein [Candidatus Kapabacteria bacterium]|nr:outer membrane beta-barrel protein [Candidatus Kapabacteria bacterium]